MASMALVVQRPKLNLAEKLYLPAIVAGLAITFKHLLSGQRFNITGQNVFF